MAGTENRNGRCPRRRVRWQELSVHNTSAQFSPHCLSPGTGRGEIKKAFPSACGRFSTMQHMADNSTAPFIHYLFPLPFFLGTWLLPDFTMQCPQHTNHVTPRAPSDRALTELEKPAIEESGLLQHPTENPPTQTGGQNKGDCH